MTTLIAALVLSSISLNIEQAGRLSPVHVELAVSEMRQIWRDCGVTVTPRGPGALPALGEAAVSLRVVGFEMPRNTRGEPILAWVAAEPSGAPAPVVFVSLPAILGALTGAEFAGVPFTKLTKDLAGRLVARAVGRVAAHELGHYLLQRAGHGDRGLMRPSYTARELVGAWLKPFRVAEADRPFVLAEIAALADARHGLQP